MTNDCRIMLKWIEKRDSWHMYDKDLHFIQEFYDCRNMGIFFKGLNKKIENWYFVKAKRIIND